MSICTQESILVNSNDSASSYIQMKSMKLLNMVLLVSVPSVFIVFGTVGNLVNLTVLFRRAFSKKITCTAITLRFLAYVDLAVLWTSVSRLFIMGLYDFDFRSTSLNVCRTHKFWHFFSLTVSNWTIVLLAFTRYIRMTYPFRVHIMFSQCRIYLALTVIFLLAASTCLVYYKNYTDTGRVYYNCEACVLVPGANTVVFKMVQLMPVYVIPGCLILFFHWRIIVNYQQMLHRRDSLRKHYHEIAKKILDLKSKIDVKEEPEMPIMTNAPKDAPVNNYSNVDIPAITPDERFHHPSSMKDFNTVSKQKSPKKIRFSHVVDLETAKVEILSCCSKLSMGSCSSVDPSMDIDTTEVKRIMLIKEERNLRRIRASYGILYLAALSDDYIVWDDSNRVRKRKRHDTLDVIGRKGLQGCCMLRTPTLRVVVACASVIFIIFHTPFCVWYSISHMFPGHTMYDTAKKNLASTVVLLLTFCCNAINFLLYSTLTSKFQAELCSCLMCYHDVRRKQLSPNDSANVSEISVTEED